MAEIPETAITWTHDDGKIHIDTRSAKVVNKLLRMGIEPEYNEMPGVCIYDAAGFRAG